MVVGECGDATLLEVLACGRFIADEMALHYAHTDVAPFSAKGPVVPVSYVEGQRFSIYDQSSCWSREQLARAMRHGSKVWSLELHGPIFDDEVLAWSIDETLEILDLRGATLRGLGLRGLSKLPKLRVLRMRLGHVELLSLGPLPRCEALAVLDVENVPRVIHGVAQLGIATPNLKSLSLAGRADTVSDAVVALPKLTELRLTFSHVPSRVLPGAELRTLRIWASASNDGEVSAFLARVPDELENLHLRGTPVTDALFDALGSLKKLRYLDVVDTAVTVQGLARFTAALPRLRYQPSPRVIHAG